MAEGFDVIVVGAGGAMGSSACMHLALRGARVLGIEQFQIGGHARGSSHGHSRMIRKCYFEHPDYVPLLERAYVLWRELERRAGLPLGSLLRVTGGVYMGPPGCVTVEGSRRAAEGHGLAHEVMDRARLAKRFPQFHVGDDFAALYEPDAGYLLCERVIAVQTRLAVEHGAVLRGGERVVEWAADGERASVRTDKGEYKARMIVFTAGAWATRIVTDLGVEVTPTRQALGWVRPKEPALFAAGALPVWAIDAAHLGEGLYYGFPMSAAADEPEGFKLARHVPGPPTEPDRDDRAPVAADEESFRPALRRWLPDADGPLLAVRTCMYENSPDQHFIIDRHPRRPNALIACGFSGHGFKFASVVGEVIADLALDGGTRHPVGFLGLGRFGVRSAGV